MKSHTKKLLLTAMATIAMLTGCATSSKEKNSAKDGSTEDQTMKLMTASELTTLDTSVILDFPDALVQTAAFEGLYGLDKDDNLIPAVASKLPTISEDGKTYTIPLRKDAKWSNGEPVTAHDFEYAWKKIIEPKNALVYSFLLQDTVLNATEIAAGQKPTEELGVKSLDDHTLEVKLAEARPYFTSLLAFPTFFPQNQKYVEKMGKKYGTDAKYTIFNGPFIVKKWKQSDIAWDLEKNDNYWDKKNVRAHTIHYDVIKDSSTALKLYDSGQLDAATLKGELSAQNSQREDYLTVSTGTITYIRLNQERDNTPTPLANEDVRKALAFGIDKKTLIKNLVADGSEPIYGLIPANFVANPETKVDFRKESGDLMKYNQKKARKHWQAAQEKLGEAITLDLLVNDEENYKKMAEGIQGQLQQLLPGLTINITSMPTENALTKARESDFDMFLIYWKPDYQDPISTLNVFRSENKMHYSNPNYDKLLEEASTTLATQPEKRWNNLIAAEKELIENTAGTIAISQQKEAILQNPKIKGLEYHMFAAPVTLKNAYKK